MKKLVHQTLLGLFLCTFALFSLQAEIKMPAFFCDNMMLQQQTDVAIWGWAKPNATVKVTTSWNGRSYSTKSDSQGSWKLKVGTPVASYKTYMVTISDGKAVTLKNVMIGEVWVCSGQSNVEMPMRGWPNDQPIEGGPEAILHSQNPGIRCFTTKIAYKASLQDDCVGVWEEAGPETTPRFTATGYFFARLLNKILDVPIGLINTSMGGSRIETWMTPNALEGLPNIQIPATDTDIKSQYTTPTVLYNGMLHPIVGYAIRGAIWYQGEANRGEPEAYSALFDRMVREWRKNWGIGEFPFYYCQLAPFNYGGGVNSGFIREAQAKGMETTPNTGMAVLMDSESPDCIHPAKKHLAGERMALWALAKTYGMDKIHYRSPEVKSVDYEGRLAVVTFDHTGGSGLTSKGKQITKFQIAGEDKRFHWATAALAKNKIYLFSPAVVKPVAVRYCFDDTSATEIFTIEGNLPLSSFRTDDWK